MFKNGSAKRPVIFRKAVPAGENIHLEQELTGNGSIDEIIITFAAGENGTLHITPYVILNGNIRQELLTYAGDMYISGDNSRHEFPCYQPIERHAKLCVDAHNTGAAESQLSVDITVNYNDYAVSQTIIGSK